MRKLPVVIAAAGTIAGALFVLPAVAAPPEYESQPPTSMNRDLGSMKGGMGERRSYGYEREGEMRRDMHRYGGARGQFMREGCKYITVRERQGDEIIVRHFRRCFD
jgi:hypothetical protein